MSAFYRRLAPSLLGLFIVCSPAPSEPNAGADPDLFAGRRLLQDVAPDTNNLIQYHGRGLTAAEYDVQKRSELEEFDTVLKQKFGNGFRLHATKHFNIACECDRAQMRQLEEWITVFYESVYPRYFRYEINRTFRIIYFANRTRFIRITGMEVYGFYRSYEQTLYTYVGSGPGTLWHELVHAFIAANSRRTYVRQWFDEGFASFYEMAAVRNGTFFEGYTNWRHPALRAAIRDKKLLPLRAALRGERLAPEFGYAGARFFFCYLWINGWMEKFVQAYLYEILPRYPADQLDAAIHAQLEIISGMSLEEMERDYHRLALELEKNQKLNRMRQVAR
ncbi:MAG: hypothetical protein KDK30_08750 [Leptospiraceae bacterium]|nr:hypothetical protein [Leptospiraceae bacterium]